MTLRRFAVLGDPIAHSLSPRMHAAAYRAYGLPHTYEARRIDAAQLAACITDLRLGLYAGYNVTVPHKVRALTLADIVGEPAALCGAANTLVRAGDGRIYATNTDVPALAQELQQLAPERSARDWAEATALVLGTGGAARAAIGALASVLGVRRVVVAGRRHGETLASETVVAGMQARLGALGLQTTLIAADLQTLGPLRQLDTLVQTTSAELHGAGAALANLVNWVHVAPNSVALDVAYVPAVPAFVTAARAHGLRAATGLGMLARQGALAFSEWLGLPPPYAVMLAALTAGEP